ncbi:PREDICTED: uncharacterized protein LOC108781197 [Cyphomyrmex costatus]|uniref:uncharacterized protein LOC108781197 n=1 Tax=Cyphomyrmex costatus TaxID=456900 RepID=UPI0008523329|nr:PREDICTED: uncharacterized protein LOC108781197 [Cyphomyrmex costatus]
MSVEQFNYLLSMVEPYLQKFSKRTPHPPGLRLALTLSFLAHGDSVSTIARGFRIGKSTAYKIIIETCNVIWTVLQPIYLTKPTAESWKHIAKNFYQIWNFPNCIGAVDGKHIQIQRPPRTESLYFNYKQFFSIVLMAAADAEYKFTWVDIGDYGSMSDGGVWAESAFGSALEKDSVDLPLPCLLPNSEITYPHFFVGDEAFPLKKYMMRPYSKKDLGNPERIFNYRLSRARRVIENAFGILTTKWRILRRFLCCSAENAEIIVKALICLHNFLLTKEGDIGRRYCPNGLIDYEVNGIVHPGAWRTENTSQNVHELRRTGSNNAGRAIINLRNVLRDYVNSKEGEVEWQWNRVFRNINVNLN